MNAETFRNLGGELLDVVLPRSRDLVHAIDVISGQECLSFAAYLSRERLQKRFCVGEIALKRYWVIEARKSFDQLTVGVENIVNAVAGDGTFKFAAVAEVDRDAWDRTHSLPRQYETVVKPFSDLRVRIEHGAKKATVGAT